MSRANVSFDPHIKRMAPSRINSKQTDFIPHIIDKDQFPESSFSCEQEETNKISCFIRNNKITIAIVVLVLIIVMIVIWYKYIRKSDTVETTSQHTQDPPKQVMQTQDYQQPKPKPILKKPARESSSSSSEQESTKKDIKATLTDKRAQILKKRQQTEIQTVKVVPAIPSRTELVSNTPKVIDSDSDQPANKTSKLIKDNFKTTIAINKGESTASDIKTKKEEESDSFYN